MRSAYFLAVRAVINKEDPAGLIALGAPDSEYDAEVEDLIKWREPITPAEVTEVFLRWFGMVPDELTTEVAVRIAAGANGARLTHLPE